MSPTAIRLAVCYTSIFAVMGIVLPFYPAWLETRGLGADDIGLILGLATAAKAVANPLAARAAEWCGSIKGIAALCAVSATVVFAVAETVNGFGPIMIVTLIVFAAWSPLTPLTDTLSLRAAQRGQIDYGRVRLWGSIAFIAASVGAGWAVEQSGASIVYALVLVSLAVAAVLTVLLPSSRPEASEPSATGGMMKNPRFWAMVVAVSLVQASHAPYYGFGTLEWQRQAIGESTIGALWAWGVIAEILLFAVASRFISHWTPIRMLMVGAAGAAVRWLAMTFEPSVAVTFGLQTGHALSFAIVHLAAIRYVGETVETPRAASAIAVMSSATGLSIGLALMAAGPLYDAAQSGVYFMAAILAGLGGGIGLLIAAASGHPRSGANRPA